MTGYLRPRGPDRWEVSAPTRDPLTGRRTRFYKVVHGTRADAELALAGLVVELAHYGPLPQPWMTVEQLVNAWLNEMEPDLGAATMVGYRQYARNRIVPALGDIAVPKLTVNHIDAFYAALRDRCGLSVATRRQVHAILSGAMKHAWRKGWIRENPAARATVPRGSRAEITPPTDEEVIKLLLVAEESDPAFLPYLHLAAATGARRSELCALRWPDVDLEGATVTIQHALERREGALVLKDTKTHGRRRIALEAATVAMLAAMDRTSEWVFPAERSAGPMPPDTASHRWEAIRRAAGLRSVRLHDLRHWSVTTLLSEGVDPVEVAGRHGHRDKSVTLNIYGHFSPPADRRAAGVLGRKLRGEDGSSR